MDRARRPPRPRVPGVRPSASEVRRADTGRPVSTPPRAGHRPSAPPNSRGRVGSAHAAGPRHGVLPDTGGGPGRGRRRPGPRARWPGHISAPRSPSDSRKHSPESSVAINTHRSHQPSTDIAPESAWYKSSYSDGTGNYCIEAAELPAGVGVRDSKDKQGPALVFARSTWSTFVTSVSDGNITMKPHPATRAWIPPQAH
ncbi:DUF397 domain-containing protein [Streptomyces sp. NPDC051214]|uniref:DUF397 domain-containing protein n=1 Tax=Streptomyces sp. NPDC051214 TaxID=3155282 RepID=UPI003411F937